MSMDYDYYLCICINISTLRLFKSLSHLEKGGKKSQVGEG
jgi:hypothetical protein